MRQHPDDFHHEDLGRDDDEEEEDLQELGTPVYQGSGLSVRALTAEELQRFLDAHHDQPAELLGSGWAALDQPEHPLGVPRTPPEAGLDPPRPPAVVSAGPPSGSLGGPGRSALAPTGSVAPPSWPSGPAAWPGGRHWSPPPASPPTCSPPRLACHTVG